MKEESFKRRVLCLSQTRREFCLQQKRPKRRAVKKGMVINMKSSYLLLVRTDSVASGLVQWMTKDPYTHISISLEESLKPLYSFARKYAALPLPLGLVKEQLDVGFYRWHGDNPCALLACNVEQEVFDRARRELVKMYWQSDDYHYSMIGLAMCKMNIPYERPNHYFCSQFVGEILTRSGAVTLPKPPSLMRPSDYDLMPEFTCVFRGRLADLAERINGEKPRRFRSAFTNAFSSRFAH